MSEITKQPSLTSLSPESQKALEQQAIKAKLEELKQISRLVVNTLNLICSNDITIPSSYAKPVGEIQDWLSGMHKNLQENMNVISAMLPKETAPEAQQDAVQPTLEVKA